MSIAAYPKYESFKPSGFDWVENVPRHWNVEKLGSILTAVSERNQANLPLLSITREQGVIERNIEDQENNHNFIPDDLSGYKVLRKGQFGMNKMKAWQGSYGVSQHTGIVSPAYFVFDFAREVDGDFFNIAIRSKLYVSYFGSASDGVRIGQWDLNQPRMRQIPILLPPISEQRAIAAFLDEKCAKIDEAVRIKEEQIHLLRERRQILIQQAVTRGLNPDAPMKDSGIDWVGQIPAHWDILPLKFIANLRSGDTISSEQFTDAGYPVFGGNGFRGYTTKKTHSGNFVLIGRQGALCGNVNYAQGDFFASEHAIVVTPKVEADITWLGEIIRCSNLNRLSQSAAQPGLSVEVIGNQRFPLPSIPEQMDISTDIVSRTSKIDKAISTKEAQIAALKEYKTTLINAAVTGKIKVI